MVRLLIFKRPWHKEWQGHAFLCKNYVFLEVSIDISLEYTSASKCSGDRKGKVKFSKF